MTTLIKQLNPGPSHYEIKAYQFYNSYCLSELLQDVAKWVKDREDEQTTIFWDISVDIADQEEYVIMLYVSQK